MAENPIELLAKSQQLALKLATDTLRTVRDTTVGTVTAPDELVRQVAGLASAVTGMAGAVSGIAGATAQPLQDFLVRQREIADTMATLASTQAELSLIVASLAERHAATVDALERLSAPVFALVGTEPTPSRASAVKKKAEARTARTAKRTAKKPAEKPGA